VTRDSRYFSLVGSRSRGPQIAAAKAQENIREWQRKQFEAKEVVKQHGHIVDAEDRTYFTGAAGGQYRWRCRECHEELNVWRICNAPCKARLPQDWKQKIAIGKAFRRQVMGAAGYKKWCEQQKRHLERMNSQREERNAKARQRAAQRRAAAKSSA
jgi:hypothetical protein